MGEEEKQNPREENGLKKAETAVLNSNDLLFHEQGSADSDTTTTTISSLDSMKECLTSSPSTSDFMEDASSSPAASYNSSSSSAASSSCSLLINDINGPLGDLSELMAKLPLKRGLSEYYQGKSQSFTCLASANSLEDLEKKENPYNKRIKMCGGLLDLDEHFSERFCSDPKAATTSFAMKSTDNSSRSASTVSAAMGRRRRRRRKKASS